MKKQIILLFLAIIISSSMGKKYDWSANVSAPKEYPVEVYTGAAGGYFFSQMGGFSNSGWGSGIGDTDIKAPLPERLDMTWLSYVDNKMFTGDWKLPTEKIQQLFDEGYHSRPGSEKETYDVIKIGLAPKGMVVVWVMGVGQQVEVARYQAHETTIDPKLITESEKYMFEKDYAKDMLVDEFVTPKRVRVRIEQYGYPSPKVYEDYREKYLWKPKIILPEGSKITSLYIKMCNGENEDPYDWAIDQKYRAIPYAFQIYWTIGSGKNEQRFVSRIAFTNDKEYWANALTTGDDDLTLDFDQNEIRSLFKDHLDKNKSTDMVIKIDPNNVVKSERVTDLYLEQEGKQYHIKEKVTRTGKVN